MSAASRNDAALVPPPDPTTIRTDAKVIDLTQARPSVIVATPSGPILTGARAPAKATRPDTYVSLLGRRDRLFIGALTIGWLVGFVMFWSWWLQPEHRVGWFGLLINTTLLFYLSYLPCYFLIAVNRLRGVNPELAVPSVRAAFVVTKAPSEPWPMVRTTLQAMLDQRYSQSYAVWLCDEDPSEETLTWCRQHGVKVSTRRGVAAYHQPHWPRRTRCKEGNLAFFYDTWGYRDYDVVVQLDCDHVPGPDYLTEMVRPFADPAVGYVAAPSMCDSNAAQSWSARGRMHREGTFHGPFQTGHGKGLAPLCIGSHYAVRTRALRDIGGIGPELAEDFSTSFLLNSAGWHGAFAHRAEAHGEGPHTFAAMLTQEFQWSRSLVTVLYDLFPSHLRRLPWKLRLRFLFALSYYPMLAITTSAGLILPPLAAVTGIPWVNVNYFEFVLRWSAVTVWLVVITVFVRRRGLLRPQAVPVVSWENWLYSLARWPLVARGVLAATGQKLRPRPVGFRVTPKSRDGLEPLPAGLITPYAVITLVLASAAVIGELTTRVYGYVFLCILGGLIYAVVSIAIPLLHAREAVQDRTEGLLRSLRATAAMPLALSLVSCGPLVVALALFPGYVKPLFS